MTTATQQLEQVITDLGLVVTSEFVPYSQSRSYKKDAKLTERNLNWRVSLKRMAQIDGEYKPGSERTMLTADYSAGIAHCPSYTQGRITIDVHDAIVYETEHGKKVSKFSSGKAIEPKSIDVIASLLMDSDVLNYSTFESWASELGYGADSRSAEKMYRECLATALALRNGIGDDGLRRLQEAAQDY